jgi:DNA-binding PadR family transcriptional regulator
MRRFESDGVDLGRFAEPGLMILISLAEGPKHGYAMLQDIESLTGSRPGPGTLYGAIARLEEMRLIERVSNEGHRNPYRLTGRGLEALRARLSALEHVARAGRRRLARA